MATTPIPGLDVVESTLRNPKISPGGMSPEAAAWLQGRGGTPTPTAPAATESAATQALRGARNYVAGASPGPVQPKGILRSMQRLSGPAIPLVAAATRGVGELNEVGQAYANDDPNADTRAAEGVARTGAAGAGAAIGATYGGGLGTLVAPFTGPFAPVMPYVGATLGGGLGGWLGPKVADTAIAAGRDALGVPAPAQNTGLRAQPPTAQLTGAVGSGGGSGVRGDGYDDPRRLDRDPSRLSLGASRDFSKELGTAPVTLPGDLRSGVIFKTSGPGGTVYSGRDVGPDAQMVDGKGATIARRGSVSVVDSGGLRGDAVSRGTAPAPVQTEAVGIGQGARGNMLARSADQRRQDAETLMTSIDAKTRERGAAMMNDVQQGEAQANGLRTAGMNVGAQRYAADQRLAGELAQANATTLRAGMEMRARMLPMQIQAEAMRRAGGNPDLAAQYIAQMGGDPSAMAALASGKQERDIKDRTDAESYFHGLPSVMSTDKDGKPVVNDALVKQHLAVANQITGGKWSAMTPDERKALAPEIGANVRLMNGINARKDPGLLQAMGWDPSNPSVTQLPDFNKASVSRVGGLRGALTPGGVERGDYRIVTAGGREYFVPSDAVDEQTLAFMKRRGANIKD